MRINITSTRKLAHRRTPSSGIGCSSRNIPRNLIPRKEPDIDSVTCPLHSVDASADGVEAIAVRLVVIRADSAARVGRLPGGVDVAVACVQRAREAGVGDCASA